VAYPSRVWREHVRILKRAAKHLFAEETVVSGSQSVAGNADHRAARAG
jgi:hypothetical protein